MFQASPRSLSSVTAAGASISNSSAFSRDSDDRSDCSSEVSGHGATIMSPLRSPNTLLASHDNNVRSPDTSPGDQHPDLLWRRTPLRNDIGRVSSIGRYESTVDSAPDTTREQGTKQTSRLARLENLKTGPSGKNLTQSGLRGIKLLYNEFVKSSSYRVAICEGNALQESQIARSAGKFCIFWSISRSHSPLLTLTAHLHQSVP